MCYRWERFLLLKYNLQAFVYLFCKMMFFTVVWGINIISDYVFTYNAKPLIRITILRRSIILISKILDLTGISLRPLLRNKYRYLNVKYFRVSIHCFENACTLNVPKIGVLDNQCVNKYVFLYLQTISILQYWFSIPIRKHAKII